MRGAVENTKFIINYHETLKPIQHLRTAGSEALPCVVAPFSVERVTWKGTFLTHACFYVFGLV